MTPEEAKKAGCECYDKWPQYKPIRDMLVENEIITVGESYLSQTIAGENAYSKQFELTYKAKAMGLIS